MEEFFTVPEVAKRLRVKATTIRVWIKSGVLEAEKLTQGKRHRYRIHKVVVEAIEQAR